MFLCFISQSFSEYYQSKSEFYSEVEYQRCLDHNTVQGKKTSRRTVSYNDVFSFKNKNENRNCNQSSCKVTDGYFNMSQGHTPKRQTL